MVKQTNKELAKAAQPSAGDRERSSERSCPCRSRYIAFFWKSNLGFEAKLGNGEVIANPCRTRVKSCFTIAESVMTLLDDEKLRVYPAK